MRFTFVGGDVGLDFLATKRDRDREPDDLLTGPAVFAEWCEQAGLVTERPDVSDADLERVLELRESAYRLVLASIRRTTPRRGDREALNRFAADLPVSLRLDEHGGLQAVGDCSQVLAAIARGLVTLISGAARETCRECDGETCTRLFVDRSRAQNRRFCSDRICGNQAKVAAFRRRAKRAVDQ